MKSRALWLATVMVASLSLAAAAALALTPLEKAQQRGQISYSQDLVPIFRGYCMSCHEPGGEGYKASGFDPSTYAGLMKGTKYGSVIVPYEPDASTLDALVEGRTSPEIRMPFDHHPLPTCLQEEIRTWVFQGAKNN